MDDLQVPPGPGLPSGVTIPGSELSERFSHASGPGGQGVNTSDSRVQLRLDISTTTALDEVQRERALAQLAPQLSDGVLTVTASEHRSQLRNRAEARARLAAILREALAPVTPRRPSRASRRRRLDAKRHRSAIKQDRRRPRPE
ncbi:ribosome-associated protein [Ruaniaceae bacterium KH17]|nr:ribosome-associated protein [Ruaniaceae bacterium KH17]